MREAPVDVGGDRSSVTVEELLFLAGALIAPMDLLIVRSFTAYDLSVAGLAVWIVLRGGRLRRLPRTFVPAVYVFLLFALVSTFRATYPFEALTQELQFAFIFFVQIPLILTVVRTPFLVRATLGAFVLGSLLPIVVALATGDVGGANRAVAFYSENANRLGYPTAYLSPFLLWFVMDRWRQGRRLLALAGGLAGLYLMIWALAASASRGAAVGIIVALLLYLAFRDGIRVGWRSTGGVVLAIVLVGGIGLVLYRSDYFPSKLRDRIEGTLGPEKDLEDNRLRLDAAGIRAFEESPIVGTGLDNFRHVSQRYGGGTNQAPHNMWIQFLAQVGLAGALAFLILIVRWFVVVARACARSVTRARRELLWAFVASMASLMAIYMTTPLMIQRHYWLIFGLALAASGLRDEPWEARPAGAAAAKPPQLMGAVSAVD